MKDKLLVVFIILLFIPCNFVYATTLQDLYNELANLESSYNAAKNKANMTQAEINRVRASINTTEREIAQAESDIVQAEKDINKSEDEIAKRKEETNQMLKYLQIANSKGSSMIEYIFEADDYTDLIYRYSVVTQMSEANKKLMDELKVLIQELEVKKVNLRKKQTELTAKKKDLQSKSTMLQLQYEKENDSGLSIAEQISAKRRNIKYYENLGCKRSSDITSCNGVAAVTGWVYPISTFLQSSNYGWDENRYHYAVDLGVGEGTAVKAVGPGRVLYARASGRSDSCTIDSSVYNRYKDYGVQRYYSNCTCGGNVVQILHTYNGRSYVSLYMHLLSINVSEGSSVSAGQVIGYSGGGPSEIKSLHDHCTGGPHLHFTMSEGSGLVGKSSMKGNTFDPVRFFPAMKGIGARL